MELAAEVEEKDNQITNLNNELDELEREAANRSAVHEQVVSKLKQVCTRLSSHLLRLRVLTIRVTTLRNSTAPSPS